MARLSAEGGAIECNKAFADFLDREAAGATGQLLSDLIEPPQRAALTAALEELAARGSAASGTALELRMGRPVAGMTMPKRTFSSAKVSPVVSMAS